jgi:hypothetical protein
MNLHYPTLSNGPTCQPFVMPRTCGAYAENELADTAAGNVK